MAMSKAKLIERYENMMYKYGEYDVWEDDILPKLQTMGTEEINKMYKADKEFYSARERAGGYFG